MNASRIGGLVLCLMAGTVASAAGQRLSPPWPGGSRSSPFSEASRHFIQVPGTARSSQATTIPLGMIAGAAAGFGLAVLIDDGGDGQLENRLGLSLAGGVVGLIVGYYLGR
jgi:hypothetical protein